MVCHNWLLRCSEGICIHTYIHMHFLRRRYPRYLSMFQYGSLPGETTTRTLFFSYVTSCWTDLNLHRGLRLTQMRMWALKCDLGTIHAYIHTYQTSIVFIWCVWKYSMCDFACMCNMFVCVCVCVCGERERERERGRGSHRWIFLCDSKACRRRHVGEAVSSQSAVVETQTQSGHFIKLEADYLVRPSTADWIEASWYFGNKVVPYFCFSQQNSAQAHAQAISVQSSMSWSRSRCLNSKMPEVN
jgi:hypothetical protein